MPTVLITGSNRGLGLGFARQYAEAGWDVIASCRSPENATELTQLAREYSNVQIEQLDSGNFSQFDALAEKLTGRPIDVLINNAAVFGPKPKADGDMRQNFGHLDYELLADIFKINTLAPLKLTETLFQNVMTSDQKKIITLSSVVASIGEGGPGLYAYRTSKTALNMAMAALAHEAGPQGGIVTLFSPGWVKTDMGGSMASLEIDESINKLRKLIDELSPADNGRFIDYDGRTIPW